MLTAMRYSLSLCLLLLVALLGTGCGSTKTVGPDGSPYRSEINEVAKGGAAEVALRNGEELKLKNFRIDADSISGLTEYQSTVSVATSRIEQVKFTGLNSREVALKWGAGTFVVTMLSSLISKPLLNSESIGPGGAGGAWSEHITTGLAVGAGVSLLTAGIAGNSGNSKTYKFESPPSLQEPGPPAQKRNRPIAKNETNLPAETNSEKRKNTQTADEEKEETSISVVDTEIPKTNMQRPDDIAVVLGVKKYKNPDVPNVDYAVRDAQTMKKYLTRTLGFREENIIYVENATGTEMERIFGTATDPQGQLHDWVKSGESSVFVYYSGHGAPNPESGDAYFIPSDTNPNYLSQNGYPVNQLYENLAQLPAESVTVVLEACFSGTSESGAVVSDISPAVLSVENPVMGMENGLAFTAGAADQVSTWYNEKGHGLFTYYFLNGLRGEADANDDEAVTVKEMESYLNENVPYRAQRMHSRNQTPQVIGQDKDRVLVRYGDSAPAAEPKAALPITTTDVQQSVKQALSLPDGAAKVESATNVDGLQQGDVITTVNDTDLDSEDRLTEIVNQHDPGDTLELNIIREGKPRTVSVTLTASQ